MTVGVAVLPQGLRPHVADAVIQSGGHLVAPAQARMLVWTDPTDPEPLEAVLAANPQIDVVQLLWAGVEEFAARGMFNDGRTWACGKGVYADPVAEHALALALSGLRGLPARATATSWGLQWGTTLFGANVSILGGGGIATSLVRLLRPFDAGITVVRNTPGLMEGVNRVLGPDAMHEALEDADVVVLALALTRETVGVIDATALRRMKTEAWLVNVARGAHVVTADLVQALREGWIGGAALDVTDPEPLPEGHPLWSFDNVLITPHTANTEAMAIPIVAARVRENVRRLTEERELVGLVDPVLGY